MWFLSNNDKDFSKSINLYRSADRPGIADEILRILSLNWDSFTCFP